MLTLKTIEYIKLRINNASLVTLLKYYKYRHVLRV